MKYKLHFSELNSEKDVECLEFTSAKKRTDFISNRVIGCQPKRVFTLIIKYSNDEKDCDIFIFENYIGIQKVVNQRWSEFWLFEWESYEDAYRNAIDLREVNPLCYNEIDY